MEERLREGTGKKELIGIKSSDLGNTVLEKELERD